MLFALRAGIPAEENSMQNYQDKQKNRQIINARSLSLEVTKHKHRLAAQLVSETVFFLVFHSFFRYFLEVSKIDETKTDCKSSNSYKIASSFH